MQNDRESDFGIIVVILCLGLGVPFLFRFFAEPINTTLLYLAAYEIRLFTLFSDEAKEAYFKILAALPSAKDLTFQQILQVHTYVGKFMRWPFLIILSLMGIVAFSLSRTSKLRRRLNMAKLLENNVEIFPCLTPIIGKGGYLLSLESYDQGLWKVARSPIQFCMEAKLLKDSTTGKYVLDEEVLDPHGLAEVESEKLGLCVLDKMKALDVFAKQLGPKFQGINALNDVRKTLIAAFLAHGAGQKQEAIDLLYDIAKTYKENDGIAAIEISMDKVNALLERHAGLLEKENALSRHSTYELPLFMAALNFARRKGVLACSQFLWLRPLDRPLWYALSQVGGKAAWAEALAPWSHFFCEEKFKKAVAVPFLDGAVEGLLAALDAEGWLLPPSTEELPAADELVDLEIEDSGALAFEMKEEFISVTSIGTGIEHKIYSSYD